MHLYDGIDKADIAYILDRVATPWHSIPAKLVEEIIYGDHKYSKQTNDNIDFEKCTLGSF